MTEYAGRWLRVSTSRQSDASQVPAVDGWIGEHGYEVGAEYRLTASASKGAQQAALDQVVADIRDRKITVLVCQRSDRLDRRGLFALADFVARVTEAGGRIEFATEPHLNDLTTFAGRVAFTVASEVAREETRIRNARTEAGRNTARDNGGILTNPPFGYVVTGPKHSKRFTATGEGREWVPQVFERGSRMSLRKLQASLTGTPLEGRTVPALASMIRNRTYLGYITSRDGRTTGRCEALVGAALFRKANDALAGRPRAGGRKGGAFALLAGVLMCPVCATRQPMYHTSTLTRGHRYSYYRCESCGYAVRLEAADALVTQAVSGLNREITVRTLVEPGHDHSEEIAKAELDLRQLTSLGLDYEQEDIRRAGLRTELAKLIDLPVTDDVWDNIGTGTTYASEFAALVPGERNDWMRGHALTVYASKDDEAVFHLLGRIAQTSRDADRHLYAVETDGTLTAVVYWGTSLA